MLGLRKAIDQLATANGVRWYEHVLRRDGGSSLRVALDLEVRVTEQVEEETEKIGLKKGDVLNQAKWRDGVQAIADPTMSAKKTTLNKN